MTLDKFMKKSQQRRKEKENGVQVFEKEVEKKKAPEEKKRVIYKKEVNKEPISEDSKSIKGIILDVGYDGSQAKAYLLIYDPKTQQLLKWFDTSRHLPYLLSNLSKEEIEARYPNVLKHRGFAELKTVKKFDLIRDRPVKMTKVIARDPLSIGGRTDSIRNILKDSSWEDYIRYHKCYAYDKHIVLGMPYEIKDNKLNPIQPEIPNIIKSQILNLFQSEKEEYFLALDQFLRYFFSPIPKVKRLAFDIEVFSQPNRIPDAGKAEEKIICISFAGSDGIRRTLVLKRDDVEIGARFSDFKSKLEIFESERELLEETFKIFKQYPIILSFNGDIFDLKYIYHRAINHLGYQKNQLPIFMTVSPQSEVAHLKNNIHIDLYKFFHNRAIKISAFRNIYKDVSLNTVSQTFLNIPKVSLEKQISELTLYELSYYCLRDSELTLNLTTFNNNLTLNLIILLMRITRLSMEDLTRQGISTWLRNLFYAEHRARAFLIPKQDYIQKVKGNASTRAMIKGKKFKGAIVVKPHPGVHFNVEVLDFACLDKETEILTYNGWKNKDNLLENDFVLTFNTKTYKLEYNKVRKKFIYDYNGEMYHLETKTMEQLITPNHRVLYFNHDRSNIVLSDKMRWEDEISILQVKDMKKNWYSIPYSGEWNRERKETFELNGITLDMDSFLAFFGIFLSDGRIDSNGIEIQISQSNELEKSQIQEVIRGFCEKNKYKFTENEYPNGQGRKYLIFGINNKELAQKFLELLHYKTQKKFRFIPRDLLMLNQDQLQILWNTLMLGTGGKKNYKGKDCYQNFGTNSKQLADDVQELSIKLGISTKLLREVRNPTTGGRLDKNHGFYRIYFSYEKRNVISKQNNPIHTHSYKGKIWCVSTENGTIMIRRNGKISITGNSLYPSIIKTWNLSYETVNCRHLECKENKIPETPHWACIKKVGIMSLIIGLLRDLRVKYFKSKAKDKALSKEERQLYKIITQSLKIIINASYGVFGSEAFPLFCLPVAEATTAIGRYAITQTQKKCEEMGIEVIYGDSVVGSRCVVIKQYGLIDVIPIENLWNNCNQEIHFIHGKQVKIPNSTYTLSKDGEWKKIKQIIRHKTNKKIFRVNQINGETICTEDHSLITENYKKIKPENLGNKKILFLIKIPVESVKTPRIVDLFPLVKHFIIKKKYKGRENVSRWKTDGGCLWFDWPTGKNRLKIKRFCKLSDLCKLLGIYIAGGYSSFHYKKYGYKASCGISSYNTDLLNKIKEIMENIDINNKINIIRTTKNIKNEERYNCEDVTYTLQTASTTWTALFASLCGSGSTNKHLPSFIYNIEKKYQKILFEYYFRGDNSIDKGEIRTFTIKSLHLVSGICYLLKSWNINVTISYNDKKDVYRVRERQRALDVMHPIETKMRELSKGEKYVYDLSVEDTEMFVDACGFLLLHNTDSVFLKKPTEEQIQEIIKWSDKKLQIELDIEKSYRYLALSDRKKNYLGVYLDGNVDIKGLTGKKRHVPSFIQNAFLEMVEALSKVKAPEDFEDAKREIRNKMKNSIKKLEKYEFSMEELAFQMTLSKDLQKYNKTIPQHVRAARLLKSKTGKKIKSGDIIRFVKTKGTEGV
ncbi:MAG: DNA polymerase domain-containing protein, partial [Promethearchaeota archaeon]